MHLHGHAFWVVRSAGNSSYNFVDPIVRDVVSIGDSNTSTYCHGYCTDGALCLVALPLSLLRMFLTRRQRSASLASCSPACAFVLSCNSLRLVLSSCLEEPLSRLQHLDQHHGILVRSSYSPCLEIVS